MQRQPAPGERRGRPAKLDRDSVLEATAALLDEHGIGAVSMRRLAARLGVSPMALYRHVGDHGELLLALVGRDVVDANRANYNI